MLPKVGKSNYWKVVCRGAAFCLVLLVIMTTLPLGHVQADAALDAVNAQTPAAFMQEEQDRLTTSQAVQTYPPYFLGGDPVLSYQPPEYSPTVQQTSLPPSSNHLDGTDMNAPVPGMTSSGDLLITGSLSPGGSLSTGIHQRSLPENKITVDLTYDVVMGFVNPYELVTVSYLTNGYGAAVADEVGFFWTPIFHDTYGTRMGIDCGWPISITVASGAPIVFTPPCLVTGGIDVLTDVVTGTIDGDTGSTPVNATLGMFDISLGGGLPPAPGSPHVAGTTAGNGSFSLDFSGFVDMGAESLVAFDYEFNGFNVRTYLYPDSPVFLVQQYNLIAGYADIDQSITATVFVGGGPGERWSETTTALDPHGFYLFQPSNPIEVGDTVQVELDGGPTLTTVAMSLGGFDFDVAADTLTGVAPDLYGVRASLWQWEGADRSYYEAHAIAGSDNTFTMNFSSSGVDLRSRDDVLVVLTDAEGDQVQINSGPPFVNAYISLDSNLDCVFGRLDGPGLPIEIELDKGIEGIYTRDTERFTDAGNSLGNLCYVIRDGEGNMVDFSPGDVVTLKDGTPGWEGSVEIVDFTWSGDTSAETIAGTTAAGDVRITLHQFQDLSYPLHGTATQHVSVSGGAFSTAFSGFDVRDGVQVELTHFNPTTGFANQTNFWNYGPTLPLMWVMMPHAVGGLVSTPHEGVIAYLYDTDGETLLAQTSEDHSDAPYWFWLDDFGSYSLMPGYKVVVEMAGGWSGEMIIPDLTLNSDMSTEMITASGPEDLLFIEVNQGDYGVHQFVPGPNAVLDLFTFGWDLQQGDSIAVTYQAPDGNRVRREERLGEIYNVGTWLSPGSQDWIWGNAFPGSTVTIDAPTETLALYANPECDGCWAVSTPLDPGDAITVTAGDGLYPVSFSIASPFTAAADSVSEQVFGQVGGWANDWVNIYSNWDEMNTPVQTDASGNYSLTFDDIPPGGSGNVYYTYTANGADIESQLWFRAPDLILDVFPSWNSIEGVYALEHNITLEVKDSDDNLKASITIPVEELWGSITGFNTAEHPDFWTGFEPPDIVPGDKIYGYVDSETTPSAYVRVGTITGDVDVDTDSISGTIEIPWHDPLPGTAWVECHPWGAPDGAPNRWVEVALDASGVGPYTCTWDTYSGWDVDTNQDIGVSIQDTEGHRVFEVFYEPSYDLRLDINYGHDWIEGWYPPGNAVTITVYENNKTTVKGTASGITGEIPWWGGGTGFSTNHNLTWIGDQPDIQPGDWVVGDVVVDEETYHAEVQLGTIDGELDVALNRFTGTVYAPWLDSETPVTVQCHPWGAPEGVNGIETTVLPDGFHTFTCDWDGEWDVPPNNDIGITYMDPGWHWIYNTFRGYTDELMLRVHYDHNWIEGNYAPGHEIHLTVNDSGMVEKASITLPTGPIDDWGGHSGFATYLENAVGVPDGFDIQPGDYIHGEVDDGSEFTADVKVGELSGTPDVDNNSISGTVSASWLIPDPGVVDVACSVWEQDGREVYDSVVPNGLAEYSCVFEGDNFYDLVPGTNLMVSYFDPSGHQILGDFSPPAAYLQIQTSFIGQDPAEGGNAAFWIHYKNQGNENAEAVTITATLEGMTYLRDSSWTTPSGGTAEKTWSLGTVPPGDWISFILYAEVTAVEGQLVSNTAEISTTSPDKGDSWEKVGYDDRIVTGNDTFLSVGKDTWTWNPAPGQNFVYHVSVCNNGSTGSSAVTLTETLPDAASYVEWWGGDPGWSAVDLSTNPLVFEHAYISSHSCADVYLVVNVDALAEVGTELVNRAEISGGNDLSPDDNMTELQHNVGEPYIDLSLWSDWHGGSLTPGGQYCYGINFRNEGNVGVAGPITINAALPFGVSFAGWDSWDADVSITDDIGPDLAWAVGDLMAGAQGTIQVCLSIDPTTAPSTIITHLSDIAIQYGEANTENNSDTFVEVVRENGPNLRVRKYGDWHGGQEGQSAWWNIHLENIGDETVHDVVLIDTYPDGMELDGGINVNFNEWWDWADNNPEDNAFKVQLDRLEPGWGVDINYNTYVDVPLVNLMTFSNVADVTLGSDIEPVNNMYEHVLVYIGERPYLQIEKRLISENVADGGNAAFWVHYRNQGGLAAEGVTITDTLVGMTYLYDTSGGTTSALPGDTEVTWDLGTVVPGDEWISFIVYAEVTALETESVSNTAYISTTTPYDDGDESEKTSSWEGTVQANDTYLNISKDTWTWNPAPGEDFVYRVTICNNGSTASSAVTLTETLPAAVSFVTWWGNDPGWSQVSGNPLVFDHTCISSYSCTELYIVANVNVSTEVGTELVNIAEISGGNDLSLDDNVAELQHNVGEPFTDLSVWHDWHWGSLVPGGHYRYAISFKNEGNVGLTGPTVVTATLPAGTSFAGWDYWNADVTITDADGPELTWEVGDMIAGGQGTIEVWVDIDGATSPGTPLTHLAEIEIQPGESYTENNSSIMEEMVYESGPNLRIKKEGGIHGHGDGHNAWYQLTVENIGDVTIEDVYITDIYPTGMILDGDININFWEFWNRILYADHFSVTLSRLEPGWNMQIDYNTYLADLSPGEIFENTGQVLPLDGDMNPMDNSANYAMATGPNMYVEKTLDSGTFLPGEQLTYLLTFGNMHQDNGWWWNMTGNAVLTDTLPEGMSYVVDSAEMHWCETDEWCKVEPVVDGQTLTWNLYPIGRSNWNEIRLIVQIAGEIDETNPLINQAAITSDNSVDDVDPYPENNASEHDPELIGEAPAITSVNQTTFTIGVYGSFTFTATGTPSPGISLTGSLPTGITFTGGTGTATLTGTPAAGSARTYTLMVTANNGINPNDVQEFTLTVNTPPVAHAGPDQDVFRSSVVMLDGSGSTDPDGDYPLTYNWTQTEGTEVTLSDKTAEMPTFTAIPVPGTLKFSLVVTDVLGAVSTADEVVITVLNQAPVANAGPDQTVTASTLVTLNGSGSTDPDGDNLTYAWEQIAGPAITLSNATAKKPTFTAPTEAGTLVFSLVVTDSYGRSSTADTVSITVEEEQKPSYLIFLPLINR